MIYFIEAAGAGLVKIGFTDGSAAERLKKLQTGCPHRLELLAVTPGDRGEELRQHGMWGYLWESGEWFRMDDRLRWYIHWLSSGMVSTLFAELRADVDRLRGELSAGNESLSRRIRKLARVVLQIETAPSRIESGRSLAGDCRA